MKLRIVAVIATLTVVASVGLLPSMANAAEGDVTGAGCMDITDGSGGWNGSTLTVRLVLAAPSCPGGTYTLIVYDDINSTSQIAQTSVKGDRFVDPTFGPTVTFTLGVTDGNADDLVCIVTTTAFGPRTFDRGPDEGCYDIVLNSVPAKRIN